ETLVRACPHQGPLAFITGPVASRKRENRDTVAHGSSKWLAWTPRLKHLSMTLPSTRRRGSDRACLFLDAHAAPARRTPTSQGAAPFGRAPSVVCCWTGGWRLAPA